MKKIYSIAVLLMAMIMPESVLAQQNQISSPARTIAKLNLGGCLVYSEATDYATGLYSIKNNGSLSPLTLEPEAWATGGGVMKDGIYYCTCLEEIWQGFYYITGFSFDGQTWEQINAYDLGTDLSFVATDLTYDTTTGKIYGCFYDGTFDGFEFGTIEYGTEISRRETIATLKVGYQAIAATSDGILYAVKTNGDLVTVNKENAQETLIGNTGLVSKKPVSATIDFQSGEMYMTVYDDEGGKLYLINTATAEKTFICTFEDKAEITGLFYFDSSVMDVPTVASDLSVEFQANALTGTVTFVAPTKTIAGDEITGEFTYMITANGETVASGTTVAGATVNAGITLETAGNYEIAVFTNNTAGMSRALSTNLYVGDDIPSAVQNISLIYTNEQMYLTWDAPVGVNGGFIDTSKVTYNITRIAGGEATNVATDLVGTSFSEPFAKPESMLSVRYDVTAVYLGKESKTASSNAVLAGMTDITLPYIEDFETPGILDMFNIIDANSDGTTWEVVEVEGNHVARVSYNAYKAMDDWLITAPIRLETGREYQISFKASGNSPSFTEHVEAFMANAATVEAMTSGFVVAERTELGKGFETFTSTFTPTESGNYFLGIHGCSIADRFYLDVDDILITGGLSTATPDGAEVNAIADESGALKAVLKIIAPTRTQAGDELSSIEKIEIKRNNAIIGTLTEVVPGGEYTFTDETITKNGENEWTVTAYNADGPGKTVTVTAYIGLDVPALVENIKLEEIAEGKVKISWTAPTTDVNGKPLNSSLTYKIVDAEYLTVAEKLEATEFIYNAVEAGKQNFVYYYINATNAIGTGDYKESEMILVGTPYAYPYEESFDNGAPNSIFGFETPEGSFADWTLYDEATAGIPDADGTNGFIGMYGYATGEQSSLYTGKISLVGAEKPALSFYYNALTIDNRNTMEVAVREASTREWTILKDFVQEGATHDYEWIRMVLPLTEYKDKVIQLRWTPKRVNYEFGLIDGIKVGEAISYDLVATSISAPTRVNANEEFDVKVTIANEGIEVAKNYTVVLYRNGEQIQETTDNAIQPGSRANIIFKETLGVTMESAVYSAAVVYADDESDNNVTGTTTVEVKMPTFPTVNDLSANQNAVGIELIWSAPDLANLPKKSVTEDFEDANPFDQTVKGWTFVDADNARIGGIYGVTLPFTEASWFVIDCSDQDFGPTFASHSGTKHMSTLFNINGEKNDDWMISPELNGEAQTISLWARSYTADYGLEQMQLLYSTTDTQLSSFVPATDVSVPANWTEFNLNVPEGTKYFAIRCTSNDVYMLFVDDVTYIPSNASAQNLNILGYNIYRDGMKINGELVTETSFVDTHATAGEHTYAVTVVYNEGESATSNKVMIDVIDGIESSTANDISITTAPRSIVITGANALEIKVYSADGKTIALTNGKHRTAINVNPGIYIVDVSGRKTKVAVK